MILLGWNEVTLSQLRWYHKRFGTWKNVASELGVTEGVVRGWLKRLRAGS